MFDKQNAVDQIELLKQMPWYGIFTISLDSSDFVDFNKLAFEISFKKQKQ